MGGSARRTSSACRAIRCRPMSARCSFWFLSSGALPAAAMLRQHRNRRASAVISRQTTSAPTTCAPHWRPVPMASRSRRRRRRRTVPCSCCSRARTACLFANRTRPPLRRAIAVPSSGSCPSASSAGKAMVEGDVSKMWRDPTVWTGRALQAESDDLEVIGLALLYPALERNVCVPGHHGYPRASDLILGKAQRGRSCHQISDATARPFLHLFISARRPRRERQLLLSGPASDVGGGGHPLLGCGLRHARLIAALLCQHCPGDPRQLVGEGRGQNVRMQALSSASEPGPEAVLRPIRWPQQNDPGCLHEEHA